MDTISLIVQCKLVEEGANI